MIEKENKMTFTLKEAKYLKDYYQDKVIGQVVMRPSAFKITELNIVNSNKGMHVLEVIGLQLSQSNIHSEGRLEYFIEELSLEHPNEVLKRMGL